MKILHIGREENMERYPAQVSLAQEIETVSLHPPVAKETQEMCDKNFFGKMKDGAYFVNTSGGITGR